LFPVSSQDIAEIALDQIGLPNTRRLAVVDKNRDLFIANVRRFGKTGGGSGNSSGSSHQQQSSGKIGAMVQSLKWNTECNMLAALQVLNKLKKPHLRRNFFFASFSGRIPRGSIDLHALKVLQY
jgi:hypothetical protein